MRFSLLVGFNLVFILPFATAHASDSPPSDEDVKAQIKRLEPTNDKAMRLAALEWLDQHAAAKNAGLAIPALEKAIHNDADVDVRCDALLALGKIADNLKQPCPLAIIESLLDKDYQVRQAADASAWFFKTLTPGSVEVLIRCAQSDDKDVRSAAVDILGRAGGKDKKALEIIEKAKQDKNFQVRHNAYCAMFLANDKLDEFLTWIIRVQQDPDGVLSPAEKDSETWKREHATRDLAILAGTKLIMGWAEERPDELAAGLVKLLEDKSPALRRGAAMLIGSACIKEHKLGLAPQKSAVGIQLDKLKAENRLRKLHDDDPDRTVRDAAELSLKRLASVREKD